jgi:DNA-binding transcriptional regulator YiaG
MGRTKDKEVIRETSFGDEVIRGLNDFLKSAKAGKAITLRDVTLELEPGDYDGESVKITRHKLGVSQAVFAKLLAVKVKTVQAWEQGQVIPSGPVRRLLDDMNQDPNRFLSTIVHAKDRKTPRRAARKSECEA